MTGPPSKLARCAVDGYTSPTEQPGKCEFRRRAGRPGPSESRWCGWTSSSLRSYRRVVTPESTVVILGGARGDASGVHRPGGDGRGRAAAVAAPWWVRCGRGLEAAVGVTVGSAVDGGSAPTPRCTSPLRFSRTSSPPVRTAPPHTDRDRVSRSPRNTRLVRGHERGLTREVAGARRSGLVRRPL